MILDDVARAIDAFPGLTRKPALLFVIVADAGGSIVTRSRILDNLELFGGVTGDDAMINTTLKHLRRSMRGSSVSIETVNGVGLRLVAPTGWLRPWACINPDINQSKER